MTAISFTFDDTFTVESREVEVEAQISEFNAEIAAKIFAYGVTAVTADAANSAPRQAAIDAIGAKGEKETAEAYDKKIKAFTSNKDNLPAIQAKTEELMSARLANFVKGIWSVRGTGGMSRVERIRDTIVRSSAKALLSAADWAKFDKLAEADQAAKVTSWYEGNKETFDVAVAERIEELDRQKAKRENLRKGLSMAL